MTIWLRKIHMYVGLLNFTILMVFGVAGLTATFEPAPAARHRADPSVEYRDFQVPPNLSDVDAAQAAYYFLKPAVSSQFPKNNVRRDKENNVNFNLYSASGQRVVTLLEKENRLKLETRKNNIWDYLNDMHTTTTNSQSPDLRIRMWTWYIELSIWSLIFMSATGVYLWLASRPRFRWAQISFATGSLAFLTLYILTR